MAATVVVDGRRRGLGRFACLVVFNLELLTFSNLFRRLRVAKIPRWLPKADSSLSLYSLASALVVFCACARPFVLTNSLPLRSLLVFGAKIQTAYLRSFFLFLVSCFSFSGERTKKRRKERGRPLSSNSFLLFIAAERNFSLFNVGRPPRLGRRLRVLV